MRGTVRRTGWVIEAICIGSSNFLDGINMCTNLRVKVGV